MSEDNPIRPDHVPGVGLYIQTSITLPILLVCSVISAAVYLSLFVPKPVFDHVNNEGTAGAMHGGRGDLGHHIWRIFDSITIGALLGIMAVVAHHLALSAAASNGQGKPRAWRITLMVLYGSHLIITALWLQPIYRPWMLEGIWRLWASFYLCVVGYGSIGLFLLLYIRLNKLNTELSITRSAQFRTFAKFGAGTAVICTASIGIQIPEALQFFRPEENASIHKEGNVDQFLTNQFIFLAAVAFLTWYLWACSPKGCRKAVYMYFIQRHEIIQVTDSSVATVTVAGSCAVATVSNAPNGTIRTGSIAIETDS